MRSALAVALMLLLCGCGISATSWATAGVSIAGNIIVDIFDVKADLKAMKNQVLTPAATPDDGVTSTQGFAR